MKRSGILAVLCLMLSVSASAQVSESAIGFGETKAAQWTFEDAQKLAAKGRLDQAMNMLDQLVVQTPVPAGVQRLRGIVFFQRRQMQQAADAFAKAVTQDAGDRASEEMEGVALFRLGRPQDALPLLEKARTAVASLNVDPQYVLGLCYAELARYDDARHAFAAQYGFDGDSPEAYLLAARLFLQRGYRDQAAAQAGKALELNPKLPLAHELLGEAALARGDTTGAIRELQAEQAINPLAGMVYERLGDAYLRGGQFTDALQALNRAILLEPGSAAPYLLLGQVYLKLNQPIEALHYLVHAEQMDPSNNITHNLLGQAYKATGQIAEANREFKQAVAIQHRDDPHPAGK